MSYVYTKYIYDYVYCEYYRENNENTLYLRITIQKCRRELAVKYKNINFCFARSLFCCIHRIHMYSYSSCMYMYYRIVIIVFCALQGTTIVYILYGICGFNAHIINQLAWWIHEIYSKWRVNNQNLTFPFPIFYVSLENSK